MSEKDDNSREMKMALWCYGAISPFLDSSVSLARITSTKGRREEIPIVNRDTWKGLEDNELAKNDRVLEGLAAVKRAYRQIGWNLLN